MAHQEIARQAGFTSTLPTCTRDDIATVTGLISEHWATIKRAARRFPADLHGDEGWISAVALSKVIASETAMAVRDVPCVFRVLGEVAEKRHDGNEYLVYLPALWRHLVKQNEDTANADHEWRMRFRAAGTVDTKIQSSTTGVEKSGNTYRQLYQGPPYAISGDCDHIHSMVTDYFKLRSTKMREELMRHADTYPAESKCLTRTEFRDAVANGIPDKYGIPEREINELLYVLDPQRRNKVSVDEFISRFGFELLKQKSLRNTVGVNNNDGATNTFQWAASLQSCKSKKELIEELRHRRSTPRAVLQSRTSYLRKAYGKQAREANLALERKQHEVIQAALKIDPPPHLTQQQRSELRKRRFMHPTSKGTVSAAIPPLALNADMLSANAMCPSGAHSARSEVRATPRNMGNVTPSVGASRGARPPATARPSTAGHRGNLAVNFAPRPPSAR
eukprot:PhM_4_TR8022/c0_g1_i1/m.93458